MSRSRVLLVDDSEAVLAFETAALGGRFAVQTALHGAEALAKLEIEVPDLLVLDLSMPVMNGEQVLARVTSEPRLRGLPVLIVSSESERARACLARGARAFLHKPIRADDLLATATRLVDEERAAQQRAFLACLPMRVGAMELAVTLDAVDLVVPQVTTSPLAFGPPYLREVFDLYGEPVLALDLAARLGVPHAAPRVDRKLVVLRQLAIKLALCVDDVRDPEEIAPENVVAKQQVGGASHGELRDTLVAVVRTARGPIPLVESSSFVEPGLLDPLVAWLAAHHETSVDALEARWE